jgi:hypothetical protein
VTPRGWRAPRATALKAAAALLASVLWLPAAMAAADRRPAPTPVETESLQSIKNALMARDCQLAVQRLNRALRSAWPGAFLMAGQFYEEGLCLDANWERAEHMYRRAHESGHEGGLLRLVAGLAAGGRDPAAALWWAQQAPGLPLPGDCRVPQAERSDPERFVAVLKQWPQARLAGCVYAAGVVADVSGTLEYPVFALEFWLVGEVEMNFWPAEARFEWKTLEFEAKQIHGWVDGDRARDREGPFARRAFERHLVQAGERALKRFNRPAGVDPAWRQRVVFSFDLEAR